MFTDKPYIDTNAERLNLYKKYELLQSGEAFDVFRQAFYEYYNQLNPNYPALTYINVNFFGLMSKKVADIALGEGFTATVNNPELQRWLDEWIVDNDLTALLYEALYFGSARGDIVFKLSVQDLNGKLQVAVENPSPSIWYPNGSAYNPRHPAKENSFVYAYHLNKDEVFYIVETYTPDFIEYTGYIEKSQQKEVYKVNPVVVMPEVFAGMEYDEVDDYTISQDNPTGRSLVVHVTNMAKANSYFGASDYDDLTQLVYALNQRLTGNQSILNDYTDPLLHVPAGTIDKVLDKMVADSPLTGQSNVSNPLRGAKGQTTQIDIVNNARKAKEVLREAKITEGSTDGSTTKPEYITYNGDLESSFKQESSLYKAIYMVSEIAPILVDTSQGFGQLSGTALKILAQPTIKKAQRKLLFLESKLKYLIRTAMELAQATDGVDFPDVEIEDVTLTFRDGLINDDMETAQVQNMRLMNGTQSKAGAIGEMDGISQKEAKNKLVEIKKEATPALQPNTPTTQVVESNVQGLIDTARTNLTQRMINDSRGTPNDITANS